MQFVGKVITSVSEFYKDINPSTLSGAIDILVISDGTTLSCSPFHVRFGKLQLLRPQEKVVEIKINGKVSGIRMKVGEAGESFFVLPAGEEVGEEYLTSPLMVPESGGKVEPLTLSPGSPSKGETKSEGMEVAVESSPAEMSVGSVGSEGLESMTQRNPRLKALSDTEIEYTDDSINQSKETVVGSPPKYSWMWGGLPQRHRRGSLSSLTVVPTVQVDLFEYLQRPAVFKSMYNQFPSTSLETIKMYHSETSIIVDENSSLIDRIESTMQFIDIDRFLSTNDDNRTVIVFDRRIVFMLSVGLDLLFGRVIYGEIVPLDIILRKYPSLDTTQNVHSTQDNLDDTQRVHDIQSTQDSLVDGQTVQDTQGSNLESPLVETIETKKEETKSSWRWWRSSKSISAVEDKLEGQSAVKTDIKSVDKPDIKPIEALTSAELETLSSASTPTEKISSEETLPITTMDQPAPPPQPKVYYKKSLRLPSEMLELLDLNEGINTISFTVTTKLQGTATCTSRIFKWSSSSKIIISDIDGTITKSDTLGHLFTMVGRDWTHSDIANLYSSISKNGYQFVYLTSRSLGQVNATRGYLRGVEQNGRFQLPDGPVITSPDRLIAAFRREVVMGNPQEFKISCLRDLQLLFPFNPFYAGFGNRINDADAYLAVGIPAQRIFIVNPSGTVAVEPLNDYYSGSYAQLIELVDQIFPPQGSSQLETFNEFWYWKRPVVPAEREVSTEEPIEEEEEEEDSLVPAYYV